ncbi:unnamed protein product [Leptidea sinapis]|uniref:Uncharacterized protein n=1 Tax=Leptidea sinapis TaxID=189913 RepID=A0A5E4R226_9NEOP|nr:unnamed protein product [Leptidea sinapis]
MEELKLHMSELFNSQMTGIKDAIINLKDTIKAQNSRIQQLEDRVSQLEKSTDLSVLENKIQKLSIKIVEQGQTLLANDIEISGCPEVQNESAMHIIKTVAHKIGISINEKDIVNVERVGPRRPEEKDKPQNITNFKSTNRSQTYIRSVADKIDDYYDLGEEGGRSAKIADHALDLKK